MRRVSLARMGEDRVYKGMNDSSGKGEVEEYAPSFSPGVQMGVIIIIFGAQSSPVKSVHPTFLHSCLVWPEAEARDVPEAPMSALLRPPRAPFVRALTRRTAAWTRPPGSRAAPPPRVSPAPPSGGRLGRAPPRSQRTCAGPFRSSSPAVFNPLTVGLARRAGISCFASLASLLSPLPPALPPPHLLPRSRRFFHSLLLFLLTLTRIRAGRLHAQLSTRERLRLRDNLTAAGWVGAAGVSAARATSQEVRSSMARRSAFPAAALRVWSILPCLLVLRAEVGQPREESLYLWIDAHQARVLIGEVSRLTRELLLLPLPGSSLSVQLFH